MRKTTKRDNINLLISAFLVIGYIVCAYFFSSFVGTTVDAAVGGIINMAIYLVFGLILFYATRVGDGKQLVRFSIPTFILIDLPAIYIIAAYFAVGLPFHTELAANTTVAMLAAAALGYGIPYTFLSGFELVQEAPPGKRRKKPSRKPGEKLTARWTSLLKAKRKRRAAKRFPQKSWRRNRPSPRKITKTKNPRMKRKNLRNNIDNL